MTACFTNGKEQAATAAASFDAVHAAVGKRPTTVVAPLTRFYVAEDYHQKYYLRQSFPGGALAGCGLSSDHDLLTSPLAAKLNSFVSGDGDLPTLHRLAQQYTLSKELTDRFARRARAVPKPVPKIPSNAGGAAGSGGGSGCSIM
jgi:hypothetical protein